MFFSLLNHFPTCASPLWICTPVWRMSKTFFFQALLSQVRPFLFTFHSVPAAVPKQWPKMQKLSKMLITSLCGMLTHLCTLTPLFFVYTRKVLIAIRGNGYRFIPKGGTFPTETIMLVVRNLCFVRSIYPNLPQMGNFLPWHVDAAP